MFRGIYFFKEGRGSGSCSGSAFRDMTNFVVSNVYVTKQRGAGNGVVFVYELPRQEF